MIANQLVTSSRILHGCHRHQLARQCIRWQRTPLCRLRRLILDLPIWPTASESQRRKNRGAGVQTGVAYHGRVVVENWRSMDPAVRKSVRISMEDVVALRFKANDTSA